MRKLERSLYPLDTQLRARSFQKTPRMLARTTASSTRRGLPCSVSSAPTGRSPPGTSASIVVTMGVVTATFGGVMRDMLGGESPLIPRKEIYATAALAGVTAFVGGAGARRRRCVRGDRWLCCVLRHPRARAAQRLVAAAVPGEGRADDGGGGTVGKIGYDTLTLRLFFRISSFRMLPSLP